ncbi:hypothetical protein B0J18DRAFT_475145 [Chaetomium sp. MPI-SDFR-AT-0129]|nr:hypothetical protein B0J18DRAFT_475145 [Chaetomium sp. MPI-SDFR-AT-0129]
MWPRKGSNQADADAAEAGSRRPVVRHVANFSYPRSDFVHLYRKEEPADRDSQASGSQPPPLVEDHGSEVSADDDSSQYRLSASGTNIWAPWQVGEEGKKPGGPRPMNRGSTQEADSRRVVPPSRGNTTTRSGPRDVDRHNDRGPRRGVVSCPEQRPYPPKPPPRGHYSLFPQTGAPLGQAPELSHPPAGPATRRPGLESRRSPHTDPPTSMPRDAAAGQRPLRSSATGSAHEGRTSATSSGSIPRSQRSEQPTPSRSPTAASFLTDTSPGHASPRPPTQPTSHTNQRRFPLSKSATRSSPSLAALAHAQRLEQQSTPPPRKPPTPTTSPAVNRALPPLPSETPSTPTLPHDRSPSPPKVSVFEMDSDDEDGRPRSGEATKNFARRLMHGLVHYSHADKKEKDSGAAGSVPEHKRSVSDKGPTTSTMATASSAVPGRGHPQDGGGIARTRTARRRRAASVDSPTGSDGREVVGGGRAGKEESGDAEKGGTFLGRIWKKKGGR